MLMVKIVLMWYWYSTGSAGGWKKKKIAEAQWWTAEKLKSLFHSWASLQAVISRLPNLTNVMVNKIVPVVVVWYSLQINEECDLR